MNRLFNSWNFSSKKSIVLSVLFLLVLLVGLIGGIIWVKSASITTYKVPEKICLAMFSQKPKDFIKNADNWASWTDDFCISAKVDAQGNLLLTLNQEQKNAWRFHFSSDIDKAKETDRIVISEDYTQFSYSQTQKTEVALDVMLFYNAFHGCFVNQLLNGVDPENMYIDFVVFERNTNEVLYQAKWPEEEVQFESIRGRLA